jgi:hypothetical protein
MLMLKAGARITGIRPEIVLALISATHAFEEEGHDCVVTACIDGKHMVGSLHYAGQAVDLRSHNVLPVDVPKLIARIKLCVGADYDVVVETDHIHMEFQPKLPLTGPEG